MDINDLSDIEYYNYFNSLSEEEIFDFIFDLDDLAFYQHIIRYIDYFQLAKKFIINHERNNLFIENSDYSNYYDLDLATIYMNFRHFLDFHGFLSEDYLNRINDIQMDIKHKNNSTLAENVNFVRSADIEDIKVFFTFIEGRNHHFGEIILSQYDCDIYIAGLLNLKDKIDSGDI